VKDQAVNASVGEQDNQGVQYIHERYCSIIERLKKYYTDKMGRMEVDFKHFMAEMSKRSI
jgi:aspartate/methionine/tyrosine aminotransferase